MSKITLTEYQDRLPLSRRERQRLADHLHRMGIITEVGKIALEKQSELFLTALFYVSKTLNEAEDKVWISSGGLLFEDEREFLQHLTLCYLERMQAIFDKASVTLLLEIAGLDKKTIDELPAILGFPLLDG